MMIESLARHGAAIIHRAAAVRNVVRIMGTPRPAGMANCFATLVHSVGVERNEKTLSTRNAEKTNRSASTTVASAPLCLNAQV
jgi:hypothetical protein